MFFKLCLALAVIVLVVAVKTGSSDASNHGPKSVTLFASADGYAWENANSNGGSARSTVEYLRIGYHEVSGNYRSVVKFDLGGIPKNAIVESAKASLRYYQYSGGSPLRIFAQKNKY